MEKYLNTAQPVEMLDNNTDKSNSNKTISIMKIFNNDNSSIISVTNIQL